MFNFYRDAFELTLIIFVLGVPLGLGYVFKKADAVYSNIFINVNFFN